MEKNAKENEPYDERMKQTKPILGAMFAWANSRTTAPKSALGKAFAYLKKAVALPDQLLRGRQTEDFQ